MLFQNITRLLETNLTFVLPSIRGNADFCLLGHSGSQAHSFSCGPVQLLRAQCRNSNPDESWICRLLSMKHFNSIQSCIFPQSRQTRNASSISLPQIRRSPTASGRLSRGVALRPVCRSIFPRARWGETHHPHCMDRKTEARRGQWLAQDHTESYPFSAPDPPRPPAEPCPNSSGHQQARGSVHCTSTPLFIPYA